MTHLFVVQAAHATVDALQVAGYTAPQHVTRWGLRIALTVTVLVVIVLALLGMRRGWQNKAKRQDAIPAPAAIPSDTSTALTADVAGTYLASTTADQWLDRIVVHSFGVPSKAVVTVRTDGIAWERDGEPDFFMPKADLNAVRLDRGIAGEVYEAGSVLIVTWRLGDTVLDTGFRAQQTESQIELATAIKTLLGQGPTASPDVETPAAPTVPNEGAS